MKKINKTSIDPGKLVGKYIPNVTAKPFELTKEYFEEVFRLTNSPRIGGVLARWEEYERGGGSSEDATPRTGGGMVNGVGTGGEVTVNGV